MVMRHVALRLIVCLVMACTSGGDDCPETPYAPTGRAADDPSECDVEADECPYMCGRITVCSGTGAPTTCEPCQAVEDFANHECRDCAVYFESGWTTFLCSDQ